MFKKFSYFIFIYIFFLFIGKLSYSQELLEITELNYYPDNSISIKADKNVKPEFFKLDNPIRWVLDFPSSIYRENKKSININNDLIKQIVLAQNVQNNVRLVISLNKDIEFEYRSIIENNEQIITLIPINNDSIINIDDKKVEEHKEKNYLVNLQNYKDYISIETSKKIEYSFKKENDIYILKLEDTKNRVKNNKVNINSSFEYINIGEEKNDTIIYIKLKDDLKLNLNKKNNSKIEINIEKIVNKEKNILVSLEKYNNSDKLAIYNESYKQFKYNIFTLDNPYRIVVDIPGDFSTPNSEYSTNNSKYIKKIRVGKLENGIRLVFDVDENTSYKDDINTNNVLELTLSSLSQNKIIKGKPIVVIDAGHGGNDPGAIGINGAREKDITLKVSYFLKDLLSSNGFNVIMARGDDTEILLQPRVDIANLNKADIFVSIHCNSTEGAGPMGIETYYRTDISLPLAKFIHKNLVNILPTKDRGIRVRNFYVIKNTIMPSVLVEIGYLTNRIEVSRLSTEVYQKDIAKSLLNGIKEYFNNKNKF